MKFEEFKSLIEERKELARGLIGDITFLRIKEIDKKLCYEEWLKVKDITNKTLYLNLMKSKINLLFEVGYEKVAEMLKNYFADEGGEITYTSYPYRENNPTFMELRTTKGTYDLGCYNDILYCLCTQGTDCWELLLRDYPNLKDYLWYEFLMFKNTEKLTRKSLIKTMIDERNKEQELLENPEIRQNRIEQIVKEKHSLRDELNSLNASLTEIEV